MNLPVATQRTPKSLADAFGVLLSQLCLAHCFLLPLILAALPGLDVHSLPGGDVLHYIILLLATPTAVYALLTGYRFHRQTKAVWLGGLGLTVLWLGTALEASHHPAVHSMAHGVGAFGSVLLVCGHIVNWRARRSLVSSDCCHRQ